MCNKVKLVILLALSTFIIAGCQSVETISPGPTTAFSDNTISIHQLASRLNMQVADTNPSYIKLRNSNNTVLIFTHSSGRFFVNGQSIGEVGYIEKVGNDFFVSKTLLSKIQTALRYVKPLQRPVRKYISGRVVIDAGHGGKDPGAISFNGSYEKTVNLQVALKVADILKRKGVNVILTRSSDRFIDLEERARIANRNNADLFVSIHADSMKNSSMQGFSVYVAEAASTNSRKTARAILSSMTKTGLQNRGLREEDFRVLVKTHCPAVLVELGYLSNYGDASRLVNSSFQSRLAQAVADGIYRALSMI
ncbi:MAG: N-acetylmuramoyl-L-alanine amidase family protein [Planctomycetota bacterium]|jgi:N-acetylmuramoyl-L-alanine amidase